MQNSLFETLCFILTYGTILILKVPVFFISLVLNSNTISSVTDLMTSFSIITDSFAFSLGGHQLVPGQGWMDEGGRGGLLWTTEQQSQYHRYQVGQVSFIYI